METDDALIVKADLPDVDLKDIDIQIENGTLTLKGERKFEKRTSGWATQGSSAHLAARSSAPASQSRDSVDPERFAPNTERRADRHPPQEGSG